MKLRIDPWKAEFHTGMSGATYWAVTRLHSGCWGGRQILQSKTHDPRRFKTESAAQKVADKENAASAGRTAIQAKGDTK